MSLFRSSARSVRESSVVAEGLSGHSSAALEEIASVLQTRERTHVLDLGPICDRTIQFFATRGSRVYVEAAEDLRFLARDLEAARSDERPGTSKDPSRRTAAVWVHEPAVVGARKTPARDDGPKRRAAEEASAELEEEEKRLSRLVLAYPDSWFDAILLWDVVDYLPDRMAGVLGNELRRVSRPGALLLVYSDARRKTLPSPVLRFRLTDDGTLETRPISGSERVRNPRENRDLFRLFPGFEIRRSTLLRTQLREIILARAD